MVVIDTPTANSVQEITLYIRENKVFARISAQAAYKVALQYDLSKEETPFEMIVTWATETRIYALNAKISMIKQRVGGPYKDPRHAYFLAGKKSDIIAFMRNFCKKDRCTTFLPILM